MWWIYSLKPSDLSRNKPFADQVIPNLFLRLIIVCIFVIRNLWFYKSKSLLWWVNPSPLGPKAVLTWSMEMELSFFNSSIVVANNSFGPVSETMSIHSFSTCRNLSIDVLTKIGHNFFEWFQPMMMNKEMMKKIKGIKNLDKMMKTILTEMTRKYGE